MSRPIWYVCHPVAGDVAANLISAQRWIAWLMDGEPDCAFIAPWITPVGIAHGRGDKSDSDPVARARGLTDDCALIARCDGIILCGGRISSGMRAETEAAAAAGVWLLDLISLGPAPPPTPMRLPEAYRMSLPRHR